MNEGFFFFNTAGLVCRDVAGVPLGIVLLSAMILDVQGGLQSTKHQYLFVDTCAGLTYKFSFIES